MHDAEYRWGEQSREAVDNQFLQNMLAVADGNPVGIILAYIYYEAVSLFGADYYNSNGPGNAPPDTSPAQSEQLVIRDYLATEAGGDLCVFDDSSYDSWYDYSAFANEVGDAWSSAGGGGKIGEYEPWEDGFQRAPSSPDQAKAQLVPA